MKYLKFFLFLFFMFSFKAESASDLVYPIQEMSRPECRFQNFSSLSSDCKMSLPILHTKDYEKYKNDYTLYRRVYTVLWAGSYDYGWDVGNGGHEGVDIAAAAGTPVYAITDGKVVVASNLAGRGNVVRIEHTINGRKVYSVYAHMSKINVSVGDTVKPLTKIGEVGSTGNSTGNHLHFQIDLAGATNPWYRRKCSVKDYNTIVNSSVCYDELNQNTLDPLLFMETNGGIVKSTGVIEKPKPENIPQTGMLSREEITKREIQDFLRMYNLKADIIDFGKNIELGKTGTLRINVTRKGTNGAFNGSFPGDMNFKYDSKKLSIFPTGIFQIEKGGRDIQITPRVAGKLSIDIYLGETFIKKVTFGVVDTKTGVNPKSSVIALTNSNSIGEIKKGVLYFKDASNIGLLGVPFSGKYVLKSKDNSMRFCIKKANSLNDLKKVFDSDCKEEDFKNEVIFDNSSSLRGIILYDYKVLNVGTSILLVTNLDGNAIGSKNLNGTLPLNLDSRYTYYNEIVSTLKLGIPSGLSKGYFLQDWNLTEYDAYGFIKNTLYYLYSKCGNDNTCKNSINSYKQKVNAVNGSKYKYLTRLDFIKLLNTYLPLSDYNGSIKYSDLKDDELILVNRVFRGGTWKDSYGNSYFQPTKTITRAEAAFLIYNIIK